MANEKQNKMFRKCSLGSNFVLNIEKFGTFLFIASSTNAMHCMLTVAKRVSPVLEIRGSRPLCAQNFQLTPIDNFMIFLTYSSFRSAQDLATHYFKV